MNTIINSKLLYECCSAFNEIMIEEKINAQAFPIHDSWVIKFHEKDARKIIEILAGLYLEEKHRKEKLI